LIFVKHINLIFFFTYRYYMLALGDIFEKL
jgi:hypothetical protein